MKKKRKKRRLKVGRLLLVLIIITSFFFFVYKFVDIPINSIIIKGNDILTDDEIIKQAKLDNYPSYFATVSLVVKKRLEKNPYIKKVKVYKGILNINIIVKEKKVLYVLKETNEKVTLTNKIKDDRQLCVPYLDSNLPNETINYFNKQMNKINKNILCQISEIKHDPNEIDKDRYYVYMNDGNSIYLTLNKLDKINKYNTILENVGKQNGTLFLDYGDYFEAK